MHLYFKDIYISLLIVIFLLPSTGMVFYVQQCNISQKMTIELEESNLCCNKLQSNDVKSSASSLINELKASGSDYSVISQLPCCKNEKLFVKLGNQLISKTITLLKNFTQQIIIITPIQYSSIISVATIPNYRPLLRPPGQPVYLEFANLRL